MNYINGFYNNDDFLNIKITLKNPKNRYKIHFK